MRCVRASLNCVGTVMNRRNPRTWFFDDLRHAHMTSTFEERWKARSSPCRGRCFQANAQCAPFVKKNLFGNGAAMQFRMRHEGFEWFYLQILRTIFLWVKAEGGASALQTMFQARWCSDL